MTHLLRQFTKEYLSEITRYERETGQKYCTIDDLKKMSVSSHPAIYAFTMTNIEKIGINPGTDFETPAGVYFYPLIDETLEMLENGTLPWGEDRKYVGIVKLNNVTAKNWLYFEKDKHFGNFEEKDVNDFAEKIVSMQNNENVDVIKARTKLLNKIEFDGQHWDENYDAQIFDLTYFASREMRKKQVQKYMADDLTHYPKDTILWNKLLRQLGFVGLYDCGRSVIHENEPTQICALSPEAYDIIAIMPRNDIQKNVRIESEEVLCKIAERSKNPNTLEKLAKSRFDNVQINVARNLATPDSVLNTLSKKKNTLMLMSISVNRNSSSKTLANLIDHDPSICLAEIRYRVANHPSVSIETLEKLASDTSPWVRSAVAYNKKSTPKVLQIVLDHCRGWGTDITYEDAMMKVIDNPNVTHEILQRLMTCKSSEIKHAAHHAMSNIQKP